MISGPSGVGKGTVVAALRQRMPQVRVTVSATTRAPRPGEVDGVHYHFLDDAAFDALVESGGFLEWAMFAGNRYGTPWSSVEDARTADGPVVLEIEVQGARQVRQRIPDAVLILLAPPSVQALAERLAGRGTDNVETVADRLRIAEWELAQADDFDHVVVNDLLDDAVEEIARILGAAAPSPP
ncbi:MAG TPA: guanylate kinase [Egibacteraceae bacterium]|nr:guanylate kinase [Egibacteraceae bacterium]